LEVIQASYALFNPKAQWTAATFLALFVALGGTSYAAINLPAGSVGSSQLRNHSITPIKLDAGSIGGFVRYWARIDATGKVIASRPHAKIVVWYDDPTGPYSGGVIRWGEPIAASPVFRSSRVLRLRVGARASGF